MGRSLQYGFNHQSARRFNQGRRNAILPAAVCQRRPRGLARKSRHAPCLCPPYEPVEEIWRGSSDLGKNRGWRGCGRCWWSVPVGGCEVYACAGKIHYYLWRVSAAGSIRGGGGICHDKHYIERTDRILASHSRYLVAVGSIRGRDLTCTLCVKWSNEYWLRWALGREGTGDGIGLGSGSAQWRGRLFMGVACFLLCLSQANLLWALTERWELESNEEITGGSFMNGKTKTSLQSSFDMRIYRSFPFFVWPPGLCRRLAKRLKRARDGWRPGNSRSPPGLR